MRRTSLITAALCLAGLAGCGKHDKPNFIYMPDMVYSPALKAQEGQMLMPPAGTVPRDFSPYPYKTNPEEAGRALKNPVQPTEQVMARGKVMFETFCMPCHGPTGEGDGTIVPKFPRPPSLQSDKVKTWTDGRIYHVISAGQNLMPTYATQIDPVDRWAIIHYIRAFQKAKNPTAEDLKAAGKQE
ncbi:MAG: cytochrome c [Oligoflexia bacterium]|nr:cytochrome c [Oligoflexia bacterium]